MKTNHFITINNKKYPYTIEPSSKSTTFVQCEAANISQEFLNEDVVELLNNLPNLIIAEKEYKTKQSEIIRFRVNSMDKQFIEKKAIKKGYPSVSSFLKDVALNA